MNLCKVRLDQPPPARLRRLRRKVPPPRSGCCLRPESGSNVWCEKHALVDGGELKTQASFAANAQVKITSIPHNVLFQAYANAQAVFQTCCLSFTLKSVLPFVKAAFGLRGTGF